MKKNNNNSKNKRRIIISIILLFILFLLSIFGCKKYNDNKYRTLLNSIPKLNNEGYWIDKDNNKLTDLKSKYKNIYSYDYYKNIDKDYKKPLSTFINEYNNESLNHKFKVNFYLDDIEYDIKEYNFLDKLVFPKDPIKENYNFKGWKPLDNNINEDLLFTSNNKIIVDSDFNFKAVFDQDIVPYKDTYKVEFYVDNNLYKKFEVLKGSKIEEFNVPDKEGYITLGWYDQFDNKFNFNNKINNDLKIKALYQINYYYEGNQNKVVNIYDHNHNLISSNSYEKDSEIKLKRFSNDYVYECYFDEDNISDEFNDIEDDTYFKFIVTKDINLVAKGHRKYIEFNFNDSDIKLYDSNGDLINDKRIKVTTGEPILFPKLIKDNYYRIRPIEWEFIDNNTCLSYKYSDLIYLNNYDLSLTLRGEDTLFSNIFLFSEESDHVDITGLNNEYKLIPNLDLNIPEYINDKKVVSISGLNNLDNINNVILNKNIELIKEYCFENSSLRYINLETSNIKSIEKNSFKNCENLNRIILPSTLNSLGEEAFYGCKKVNKIDLKNTALTSIPNSCFEDCVENSKLTLPQNLVSIGESAFENNSKLTDLNMLLNSPVKKIGKKAFKNLDKITNLKFSSNLEEIGQEAFYGSKKVKKIDFSLNNKITRIEGKSFYQCSEVTHIILPSSLKYIDNQAFHFCYKVININLFNTQLIEIGDQSFGSSYNLEEIKLPSTFKKFYNDAFEHSKLKKIDLIHTSMDKVTTYALNSTGSNLKEIYLPSTIKKLEIYSFSNAQSLDEIVYDGTKDQFKTIEFASNWILNIHGRNPIIEFNDGSSCHYNDL
ncbi:MAG: leucine-rich repeat domain-containing protein [Bacillales bacterium]